MRSTGLSLVRSIATLGPHAGAHRVAIRAGLSVLVPLLILVVLNRDAWIPYAAFGAFTALYGRASAYAERTGMQASAAFALVVGVTLGSAVALLPGRQWWVVVVGAVLTACASLMSDAFDWHPPGPLFVLFGFVVCAMVPPAAQNIVSSFLVASSAALFAMVVGHLGILRDVSNVGPIPVPRPRFRDAWTADGARSHLVRYAVGVGGAGAIATLFGGSHPYWAMVAVVAGLSGPTLEARVTRGFHRAVGTVLGVGVAAVILPFHPHGVAAVILIVILQMGSELLIGRNYALALLCITPLALMMGQMTHERAVGPLVLDRTLETLLGCLVALVVVLASNDKEAGTARGYAGSIPSS